MYLPVLSKKSKQIIIAVFLFLTFSLAFIVNFSDPLSTTGDYTKTLRFSQIDKNEDVLSLVNYSDKANKTFFKFIPSHKHFAGLFTYYNFRLTDDNQQDALKVIIKREGKIIKSFSYGSDFLVNKNELFIYNPMNLSVGAEYVVEFQNISPNIEFFKTKDFYNSKDIFNSDFLILPIYDASFFTPDLLIFIDFALLTLCLFLFNIIFKNKLINITCAWLLLSLVLSSVYTYNYIDRLNSFENFEKFSEDMVISNIIAQSRGIKDVNYGLSNISDITGDAHTFDRRFVSDFVNYAEGYSVTSPSIRLQNSVFLKDKAKVGNSIKFENGSILKILKVIKDDKNIDIFVDSDAPLNVYKYGTLNNVVFLDSSKNELPTYEFSEYQSHYGLQGKVISKFADVDDIYIVHVILSILMAVTVTAILLLLRKKYNTLFASISFFVFLLAPIVVCTARNMYWVPFTCYLPILVGLYISLIHKKKKLLNISYFAFFIFIFIKALCGYEYLSAVVISSASFILVDSVLCIFDKKYKESVKFVMIALNIGVLSVIGFCIALCMQAAIRHGADGSILKGISLIYKEDVLRRTFTTSAEIISSFTPDIALSLRAGFIETSLRYFGLGGQFDHYLVFGLNFLSFRILIVLAFVISIVKFFVLKIRTFELPYLFISMCSLLSCCMLLKGFAFIHVCLAFIIWYFGFVQVSLYIVFLNMIHFCKYISEKFVLPR